MSSSRWSLRLGTCAAIAGVWLGLATVWPMPVPAMAQARHATTFDVVKLPLRQNVPVNFDPSDSVIQGIFRPTARITAIGMNADGWITPVGAGIYLGSATKSAPHGWCNILVKPIRAGRPPTLLNLECGVEGLWYSAIRRDNIPVVGPNESTIDFAIAQIQDGGVRVLQIRPKSTTGPLVWRISHKLSSTAEIPGLGAVEVFARPQIPSDQLIFVLTMAQAEALLRRFPADDRGEIMTLLNH